MNAPLPPPADNKDETIAVQAALLKEITAQRNIAFNQLASLKVQLQFAEQKIAVLSQISSGKFEKVEKPEEAQEEKKDEEV